MISKMTSYFDLSYSVFQIIIDYSCTIMFERGIMVIKSLIFNKSKNIQCILFTPGKRISFLPARVGALENSFFFCRHGSTSVKNYHFPARSKSILYLPARTGLQKKSSFICRARGQGWIRVRAHLYTTQLRLIYLQSFTFLK